MSRMRQVVPMAAVVAVLSAGASAQRMGGPPPEALSACQGKQSGDACEFATPRGTLQGTCFVPPPGGLVCAPAGGPPGMQQGRPSMGMGQQRPQGGKQGYGGPTMGNAPSGGLPGRGYTPRAPYDGAVQRINRLTDTGQVTCFDDSRVIACPSAGRNFYGQDANYAGRPQSFRDQGNGTVSDPATGLLWQKAHNAKRLSFYAAKRACESLRLGNRTDWRLPSIKELFSISHWQGSTGRRPFLDSKVFDLEKPDAGILQGDRFADTHNVDMMGQTWSATIYRGRHWDRPGVEAAFFFNFLDGRIKQAPTAERGQGLFYRCVSGPEWGHNAFRDNGDGTISDGLTGLTWQKADDGIGRDWKSALAYCEGLSLAGHADWRLPNVKELQSIVDYSRPAPAIDRAFFAIADPKGWFWSATTHGDSPDFADYVCFGKCVSVDGVDTHGAGAQRSDPKKGDPKKWGPMGGQRDAVRILNDVRCVRG